METSFATCRADQRHRTSNVNRLCLVRPVKRLLAIAVVIAASQVQAETPQLMLAENAVRQHLLLKYPTPNYPYEARRILVKGGGVFIVQFDYETGSVRQVRVYRSTGNQDLDFAASFALKHWQAKPRSLHDIVVPITWTMPGERG
jgi:TonB family protein